MRLSTAIKHIERHGVLLVYPVDNRSEPNSLWQCFFPRSKMRWDWDANGDNRVADMWHLRERLATSRNVVYAKWYRGRATFFSKTVFTQLLSNLLTVGEGVGLMREAREVLDALEETSPLSTKELKQVTSLQGRFMESTYNKALKQLWDRLLIVGCGEKDDGAFPSLLMGATKHIFEELYLEATQINAGPVKLDPAFDKYLVRVFKDLQTPRAINRTLSPFPR